MSIDKGGQRTQKLFCKGWEELAMTLSQRWEGKKWIGLDQFWSRVNLSIDIPLYFVVFSELHLAGQRNGDSGQEDWGWEHHSKNDPHDQGEEGLDVVQADGAWPHILPSLGNRLHPLHLPGVQRVGHGFLKTDLDFFYPRVDTLEYYAITIFKSWDLPPTSLAFIFQVILKLFMKSICFLMPDLQY